MKKTIYLDMDGTICNLYGVKDWVKYIQSEDVHPYKAAKPMIDELELLTLKSEGYKLGIVSWNAYGTSESYNRKVKAAKLRWLEDHFPNVQFDEIHIIKYGQPKDKFIKDKDSILIDDDDNVRGAWKWISFHPKTFFVTYTK